MAIVPKLEVHSLKIGKASRNRIAAVNIANGSISLWNPNANNNVSEIAVNDGMLYAAGEFARIGGQHRNRIAALSDFTGLAATLNPGANDRVTSIYFIKNLAYIYGTFTMLGGNSCNGLAAYDITNGKATTWNPRIAGKRISTNNGNGNIYLSAVISPAIMPRKAAISRLLTPYQCL